MGGILQPGTVRRRSPGLAFRSGVGVLGQQPITAGALSSGGLYALWFRARAIDQGHRATSIPEESHGYARGQGKVTWLL